MSRFNKFIKSLTDPVTDDRGGGRGRESRGEQMSQRERLHQRRNRDRNVEKADDRDEDEVKKARYRSEIDASSFQGSDAVPKPYDPVLLRDLADNGVTQTYIDTISQDVASAKWSVKPRDEDTDLDDGELAQYERLFKTLYPGGTWRDFLEEYCRDFLELGDTTAIKEFDGDPNHSVDGVDLDEVIPVDSSTMFKVVDQSGIVDGYVQASHRTGSKVNDFDQNEVMWQEWGKRSDRFYGQGPIEKAKTEIELLEELTEKERLDLVQGSPPGVIHQNPDDEWSGFSDEDWANFKEQMRLEEGQRHRVAYSKNPVDFTPIAYNYQELQVLARSKYWVTVLGGVMKVNPSYAGFDFENTNRATDESQQDAYGQRGFRVVLRLIEESINRGIVWPELSEDVKFEFERETTPAERKERADVVQSQADAGMAMSEAGRDVEIRDGQLVIEDGEIEEGSSDSGGGLFMSADGAPDVVKAEDGGSWIPYVEDGVEGYKHSDTGEFVALEDADTDIAADITPAKSDGVAKGYGIPLTFGVGGEAVDHESGDFEKFLDDIADAGGMVFCTKTGNVYPPDPPEPHDPHAEVFGLEVSELQYLLDKYNGVYFDTVGKDADGGSGNLDPAVAIDEHLFRAHREQIYPESIAQIEKVSWAGDESVPEYVLEKIREVIDNGAVFDSFESLPGDTRGKVESLLEENLTQPQGWSLDSIVNDLEDVFPGVDADDLEVVARNETASVLNNAREEGYQSRDDSARYKFKWQGPKDHRETDLCRWLKEQTNPDYGGTPVDLNTLIRLEEEAHQKFADTSEFRKHIPHIQCRHTFVRVVQ